MINDEKTAPRSNPKFFLSLGDLGDLGDLGGLREALRALLGAKRVQGCRTGHSPLVG
jgi:hypothetical protein